MSAPIAYFLTWTTYGTWLQGDHRGSVDDEHRTYGAPFAPPGRARSSASESQLLRAPVLFDQEERALVEQAIRDHCGHKDWEVVAVNVRSNHVHAIISAAETHSPEQILTQLKAWSTRALRGAGYAQQGERVWTRHGSTRYLWTQEQVYRAATYVAEHQ